MTTSQNLPHRIYGWSRHDESGGVDARAVSPVVSGVMLRPRQTEREGERAKHLEQQGGLCASEVIPGVRLILSLHTHIQRDYSDYRRD